MDQNIENRVISKDSLLKIITSLEKTQINLNERLENLGSANASNSLLQQLADNEAKKDMYDFIV